MDPDRQTEHWWAPVPVGAGKAAILSLGPLSVQLHRGGDEWLIAWSREGGDVEPARASMLLSDNGFHADDYQRFVTRSGNGMVSILPTLADRPVVIRPRQPVFILPGEHTTLYISTPVWVRIQAGDPSRTLTEISVMRLSDSWFGPSTREGELCYSTRTHARNKLSEVVLRPHRAVTPVRIHNEADSQLPIEKLSLPVPLLSVYGGDDGSLWTESVSLTRTHESDMAALAIQPGAPRDAVGARLLTGPRTVAERHGFVRAFSGLFG